MNGMRNAECGMRIVGRGIGFPRRGPHRRWWIGGVLLVCLASTLLQGCAHRRQTVLPPISSDRLVSLVRSKRAQLTDLRGMARISLRVDDIKQTVRAFILYRAPDRMKMDVMGMLGSALTAVSGPEKAEIYLPGEKQLVVDYEGGYALSRLSGIELGYYDPASMLLGIVPLPDGEQVEVQQIEGRYLLVVRENGRFRRVWVDGGSYLPVEEEIYDAAGVLRLRRTMSRYERIGGADLPRRIEILEGQNSVRIEFQQRRANQGLDEDRFRLNVPSGVSRVVIGVEQE